MTNKILSYVVVGLVVALIGTSISWQRARIDAQRNGMIALDSMSRELELLKAHAQQTRCLTNGGYIVAVEGCILPGVR